MGTRAALFAQTEAGDWQMTYSHYDGYPQHMMPALRAADPQQVIDAGEIRQIAKDGTIEKFPDARAPEQTQTPKWPNWADHAYVLTANGWKWANGPRQLAEIAAP